MVTFLFETSEEDRAAALHRFKIIEPYINGRSSLSKLSKHHSISRSTLTRWITRYQDHGLLGLTRKSRTDRGIKQTPEIILHGIEALVLHQPHLSIAHVHRLICEFAESLGEKIISYPSVQKYIATIPDDLKTLAQGGSKKYDELYELIYLRVAKRPNHIWQVDHTLLDIIVLDENDCETRPWLTIVLDDRSRAIAGYYLTFKDPSALNTSLALRQAIWRKEDPGWPVCGIPEILYTDHGSDFTSKHIEQVCADLKIELIYSSVGKPRGRGKIERFFDTINQMLLVGLPGYIKATNRYHALLAIDELNIRLRDFIVKNYHHRKHSSLRNLTPLECWEKNGFLPQLPESYEQLDLLLVTVAKTRKVRNVGISFSGFNYQSPLLSAYVGESVVIRYDPRDLAEIRVYHNNKYICSAISPELSENTVSLTQLKTARKKRKAELRETIKQRKSLVDHILDRPERNTCEKKVKSHQTTVVVTSKLKTYENE
jgi:putative transposase